MTKTLSFQNEDFLYGTPKNILSFLFLGERYLGKAKKKGLLFNRPRTYRATRFYKSTWGDQLRRSFSLFFLTPLLLTFTVYKTKNGPPPLRFPFFSTKTGGDKRSRRIFCVRVFWKTVPVTFSLSPNIREKCVFVCPALPRAAAAAGAQQSFPPSV